MKILSERDEQEIQQSIDDSKNDILNPDGAEGEVIETPIAMELGEISKTDGTLVETDENIRTADFIDVEPGSVIQIRTSVPIESSLRMMAYRQDGSFIERFNVSVNTDTTLQNYWYKLKFYAKTNDLTIQFSLVGETTNNNTFKKIYFQNKCYTIYNDTIDDETMHKLVIESLGLDDNEFNIVEIKAPTSNPSEATIALMNAGNGTNQFVDFSSMRYDNTEQGTVEIVNQIRGTSTPLPTFSIRYNDGKGDGRINRFEVNPDAIPVSLTSRGIKTRRNNKYTNEISEEVEINMVEMFDKVNEMYEYMVNRGQISESITPITTPYTPGLEYGYIDLETGGDVSSWKNVRTAKYIPVSPNTSYSFTIADDMAYEWCVLFYDSNKQLISGWNGENNYKYISNGETVTAPTNATYMRAFCEDSFYLNEPFTIT